ncbi:MAG: hypothetical protein J6Q64_03720 [Clostridia bacterium]|nr:hypothetical protein [Clostridia bacterium]
MKITFLGTAAAEAMPATFCNCKYCTEARRLGGKNIRTRSQTLIDDSLLIDLPADTYFHFIANGIEGDKISDLLITHSHGDHCYPTELFLRTPPYAHNMRAPVLNVYCGRGAFDKITSVGSPANVEMNKVSPFESFCVGKYKVTALPARHAQGDEALFYIIEGDKTLLYAHDTGYFYDEVFDFIAERGFKFDFATFDCTNVDITISDQGSHMGVANIERVIARLESIGAINTETIKVINHFSHNAGPLHHVLEERVSDKGWLVSYDGMSVEF